MGLLSNDEAEKLAAATVREPTIDAFADLTGVRLRRGSPLEAKLLGYFGVVPSDGGLDESTPLGEKIVRPSYGLFPHQRKAVGELEVLLSQHPRRAMLHMPTGSGKTRTAMSLIANELRKDEPGVIIWLAYSEELCEQTALEFEEAWTQLGDREINLVRYWGSGSSEPPEIRDGFIVAGLGKIYAALKRAYGPWARMRDRTSLVIIDEAHQAIAGTYREVLELLVDSHSGGRLLGLTATPGRTWNDVEEDERLAEFFGKNKVSLSIPGYANPIEYLVGEGYLADTDFRSIHHEGPDIGAENLTALSTSLDVPKRVLERLAVDDQRNLLIIQTAEALARSHKRFLIFCPTVENAKMIAAVLRARGLFADSVTSETSRDERHRIIRAYQGASEEARIICNYGVLTAGFDAPSTSAALVARPTKSLVLYSQMVGRAIRGPRVGGNAEAEVVTVVDTNLPGFGDLAEAFFNWEDVW